MVLIKTIYSWTELTAWLRIVLHYIDQVTWWPDSCSKVYYRHVHAFTNRLRFAAQSRDVLKISQNLDTCSRGEAERWWNSGISDVVRRGLIHSNSIDDWCRELEKRFQLPPRQARENLDFGLLLHTSRKESFVYMRNNTRKQTAS